jgi:hypothetical protein
MRSFSQAHWEAAQAAWADGEFSTEWVAVRGLAVSYGILYPPNGSPHDSWDAAHPTQRAILIQAMRETPNLLAECIPDSSSWHEVIAKLRHGRDARRADGDTR